MSSTHPESTGSDTVLKVNRLFNKFSGHTGLEKGEFTEMPVKTQFGYHVILLEDTKVGEILPLSALRADLSQKLSEESIVKQLKALKVSAKIELPNQKAATQPKAKSSTAPQTPTASAAK